ncbi:MAG: phospholipid/glycerol acyltransferase [Ferruginibacter sp.]|nr:phospholipid/glycerol acyltransferase [Ferruginibacter sp.]
MHMLPVYRTSEGIENIGQNYQTFTACETIFQNNGIVLIFSEGLCINEWHLRALKKGTARIVLSSWAAGIPLQVLPTGINYQSFCSFGKNIHLHFGQSFFKDAVIIGEGYGKSVQAFNDLLRLRLQPLIYEIPREERAVRERIFRVPVPTLKKILLILPASAAVLFHFPLYFPVKKFAWKLGEGSGHYDSLLIALLFIGYPFYLTTIGLFTFFLCGKIAAMLIILLMPVFARCYIQVKNQF